MPGGAQGGWQLHAACVLRYNAIKKQREVPAGVVLHASRCLFSHHVQNTIVAARLDPLLCHPELHTIRSMVRMEY